MSNNTTLHLEGIQTHIVNWLKTYATNSGVKGFLIGISPQVCIDLLKPVLVECAIEL